MERFLLVKNLRTLWIVLLLICNLLMRLQRILVLVSILLILKFVLALTIIHWSFLSSCIMLIMKLLLLSLACSRGLHPHPNHQFPNLYLLHQLPKKHKVRENVIAPVTFLM